MASNLPTTSQSPPPYVDHGQFGDPAPPYTQYGTYAQQEPKTETFIGTSPPGYQTGFYRQQPVFIQQTNAPSSFYPSSGYPPNAVPMTYSGARLVPVRPDTDQLVPIRQSFSGHMALACFVCCCCGWLCGSIAFILAALASYLSSEGSASTARSLGRASIVVALVGLMIGVAAWGYVIWSVVKTCSGQYTCHGSCYKHHSSYYTKAECSSWFTSSCFDNGRCYYNS